MRATTLPSSLNTAVVCRVPNLSSSSSHLTGPSLKISPSFTSILSLNTVNVGGLQIKSLTGQMPGYHRVLLDPDLDLQYHLAGYGLYYEEALIRYIGEGIERSSSISSYHAICDKIVFATHRDIEKTGPVVPLEYLDIFGDSDLRKLGADQDKNWKRLTAEDVVGWIQCHSLVRRGRKIWVPAQMLFMGHKLHREKGEARVLPCFSTGTAAHSTFQDALCNALLEVIQIDALI